MTEYIPAPISTEGVTLPMDLDALVEKLAENNHDHWARQRIEDGWTYGPRRDDVLKTHPDLVPYRNVPESEKEYDRTSVVETADVFSSLCSTSSRTPVLSPALPGRMSTAVTSWESVSTTTEP